MKSKLKGLNDGDKCPSLFDDIYNDPRVTSNLLKTLYGLVGEGYTFNLKAKVGDLVFYKMMRRGMPTGYGYHGIVTKAGKKDFSFVRLVHDNVQNVEGAIYNFGAMNGSTLEGFISLETPKAKD